MQYVGVTTNFLTKARQNRYLALAVRLILGGTFIIAGMGKLPHGWELFIGLPDVLEILHIPQPLWKFIQLERLPWIEIAVGSFLLAGLLVKPAAFVSVLMTLAFFTFNGVKLLFPTTEWCNCFGLTLQLSLPVAQAIDVALLLMALLLLFHRRVSWGIDTWLLRRK